MRKYLFMMVCGSLLSLAIAHSDVAADILRDHEWSNWKQKHMKYYASDNEELERYVTWRTNKAYVEYHNALAQDFGYSLALNTFGDVGSDEFCRSKECSEVEKGPLFVNAVYLNVSERAKGAVPAAIDWRQKGIVTAVKDQGMCHGCYAFVVAGMLEGLHAITTGNLVSLSEQNIIDCSVLYGNRGCSGGDRLSAISYITDNGGINTETDYPYKARQGLCNFSSTAIAVSCTGIIRIRPGSEEDLMAAIAFSGPVSVSIDAAHNSFQFYSSGIYSQPFCSSTELTHSLLVVGYGTLNGKNYWLLKNSWGVNWGDGGYIMMTKDGTNQCGIASSAFFLAM